MGPKDPKPEQSSLNDQFTKPAQRADQAAFAHTMKAPIVEGWLGSSRMGRKATKVWDERPRHGSAAAQPLIRVAALPSLRVTLLEGEAFPVSRDYCLTLVFLHRPCDDS